MSGKVLGLMRHATAEATQLGQRDFQRFLTEKGRKEAAFIGDLLKKQAFTFDTLLISPARRTRETSQILKQVLQSPASIQEHADLYDGGLDAYFKSLAGLPDAIQSVVLVGHNPDITALAESLLGTFISMSPATFIKIHLPIQYWQEIDSIQGNIKDYTVFSCGSGYSDQSLGFPPHR